jgi:hypothetical protein
MLNSRVLKTLSRDERLIANARVKRTRSSIHPLDPDRVESKAQPTPTFGITQIAHRHKDLCIWTLSSGEIPDITRAVVECPFRSP